MTPVLLGAIPKQATRWGIYELCCDFCHRNGTLNASTRSVSGMIAGMVEAFAVVPSETLKVRIISDQQSVNPRFRGTWHGLKTIVREEGPLSLYRGAGPMVVRQAINQATRFPAQFYCLNLLVGDNDKLRKSVLWNGVAGVMAGCFSVCINQPADVVRTRMQGHKGKTKIGLVPCVKSLYAEGGFKIFYTGAIPRMARVGPNVGLTFMFFPVIRGWLEKIL
eukprot:PhF_6_TR24009/c0_g1_i1/m.33613/K15100/SLC25A1, CTP; solute carrier family 25 (mitochondrial citrate transporter), member 1